MLAPIPSAVLHRELARVSELKNTLSDPINPDAYFRNFESSLRENSLKLEAFRKMEAVFFSPRCRGVENCEAECGSAKCRPNLGARPSPS